MSSIGMAESFCGYLDGRFAEVEERADQGKYIWSIIRNISRANQIFFLLHGFKY